jgi:hypothetical protein
LSLASRAMARSSPHTHAAQHTQPMQVTCVYKICFYSPQSSLRASSRYSGTPAAACPLRHAVPKSLAALLRLANSLSFLSPHCLSSSVVVRREVTSSHKNSYDLFFLGELDMQVSHAMCVSDDVECYNVSLSVVCLRDRIVSCVQIYRAIAGREPAYRPCNVRCGTSTFIE